MGCTPACLVAHRSYTCPVACRVRRWRSDSLTVVETPEGIDSNKIVKHAYAKYDLSLGIGLAQINGKVRSNGDSIVIVTRNNCASGVGVAASGEAGVGLASLVRGSLARQSGPVGTLDLLGRVGGLPRPA